MLRAYEGYLEQGRFYPTGPPVSIQGRRRVIITVLDEPERDDETVRRLAALDKFFADVEANDEEVPEFERLKLREIEL